MTACISGRMYHIEKVGKGQKPVRKQIELATWWTDESVLLVENRKI